jgi:hypothetical protein
MSAAEQERIALSWRLIEWKVAYGRSLSIRRGAMTARYRTPNTTPLS